MINMPILKLEKSNNYLKSQLQTQNNNKQLVLDIITNIGLIINNSPNEDQDKYNSILDQANIYLNTVSSNITSIEQLYLEITNITKELNELLEDKTKMSKTKEFYIAAFSNIKNNMELYSQKFQNIEAKLEKDNEEFNEFINVNNFQYNFDSVNNTENSNSYEFTGFSINDNSNLSSNTTSSDVPENLDIDNTNDSSIQSLTNKFKDLLLNISDGELSENTYSKIDNYINEVKNNLSNLENQTTENIESSNDLVTNIEENEKNSFMPVFLDYSINALSPENSEEASEDNINIDNLDQNLINNISHKLFGNILKQPTQSNINNQPTKPSNTTNEINNVIANKIFDFKPVENNDLNSVTNLENEKNTNSKNSNNDIDINFNTLDDWASDILNSELSDNTNYNEIKNSTTADEIIDDDNFENSLLDSDNFELLNDIISDEEIENIENNIVEDNTINNSSTPVSNNNNENINTTNFNSSDNITQKNSIVDIENLLANVKTSNSDTSINSNNNNSEKDNTDYILENIKNEEKASKENIEIKDLPLDTENVIDVLNLSDDDIDNEVNKLLTAQQDNYNLIISEKHDHIYLPYKMSELKTYIDSYPNVYSSFEDVVKQEFVLPFDYFQKHPFKSRFSETYNILRNREGKDLFTSIKYSLNLAKNKNINPAIIAACKTLNELDSYLYYLESNNIKKFKFFNIIYQVNLAD